MSRIILSRYDNGEQHVVVGWDSPAGGAFWQEFNREPDPDPQTGEVNWAEHEDWQETLREGGMWPGIPLDKLIASMPDDLKPLMSKPVMELLRQHAEDPESSSIRGVVDLS